MRNFLQVFYIVFSSILVSCAIPNELFLLGSPYIALFSLAPFYLAIANAKSFREIFWLGFLQTMLVHIFSSFWLAFFKDFAAFTLGASAMGTGVIGAILARFLFLPYAYENEIVHFFKNKSNIIPFRILYFASVYTLYEWFKGSALGFLAYPWGTLSSAVFRWNIFMQTASLFGTFGITFLLAFFSALVGEGIVLIKNANQFSTNFFLTETFSNKIFSREKFSNKNFSHNFFSNRIFLNENFFAFKNTRNLFIVLFATSFMYGAYEIAKPRAIEKKINAVLVQQNADPWTLFSDENAITLSQKLTEEKINEARTRGESIDLVIWSEGVLQQAFPEGNLYYKLRPESESLSNFISRMNVPFIIGGSAFANDKSGNAHNAALLFSSDGNYKGFYGKLHLVPFAESLPGIEYERVRNFFGKVIGISAGWISGKEFTLFEIASHALPKQNVVSIFENQNEKLPCLVSCPICFDDAFPSDVCRPLFLQGTEVFVNLTDDSWSLTKSAELQHFVIASFRAIEFRTTLVRSTNAGYSCVLDATGRVLSDLPLFEATSLFAKIPIYKREITVYALFGNWFPALLCILLFAFCALLYIETKNFLKKTLTKENTNLNFSFKQFTNKNQTPTNFSTNEIYLNEISIKKTKTNLQNSTNSKAKTNLQNSANSQSKTNLKNSANSQTKTTLQNSTNARIKTNLQNSATSKAKTNLQNSTNARIKTNLQNSANSQTKTTLQNSATSKAKTKLQNSANSRTKTKLQNSANSQTKTKLQNSANSQTKTKLQNSANSQTKTKLQNSANSQTKTTLQNSTNSQSKTNLKNSANSRTKANLKNSANSRTKTTLKNSANSKAKTNLQNSTNAQTKTKLKNSANSRTKTTLQNSTNSKAKTKLQNSANSQTKTNLQNSANSKAKTNSQNSTNSKAKTTLQNSTNTRIKTNLQNSANSRTKTNLQNSANSKAKTKLQNSTNSKAKTKLQNSANSQSKTNLKNSANSQTKTNLQKSTNSRIKTNLQNSTNSKAKTTLQNSTNSKAKTTLQNSTTSQSKTKLQNSANSQTKTNLQNSTNSKAKTNLQNSANSRTKTTLQNSANSQSKTNLKNSANSQSKTNLKNSASSQTKTNLKNSANSKNVRSNRGKK